MTKSIQIISNRVFEETNSIKSSSFDDYNSFNSFEFNIIDLNNSILWNQGLFSSNKELPIITNAINNTDSNSSFIFLLPQNIPITTKESSIKNESLNKNTEIVSEFIEDITGRYTELIYGKNITIISEIEYNADFYFKHESRTEVIKNNVVGDNTIIKIDNFIFTTISIPDAKTLKVLIDSISPSYKTVDIPEWFEDVDFLNDKEENENIIQYQNEIKCLEEKIKESEELLEKNNKYKSILYTQENALVKVVYEILDEMLGTNFSEFKDVFDEDFYFEKDEQGFIGEIKGVKRNLKNEYLNQLNDHAVKKLHKFDEEEIDIPLKQLMIINTFRKRHPNDRPDIEKETLDKAEMHEALVITTPVLLKLFGLYKKGEIKSDEIIGHLKNDVGLFEIK